MAQHAQTSEGRSCVLDMSTPAQEVRPNAANMQNM